ncbi:MAG: class I SAM-dependent methyltransferase, partial [Nanoarchaeota archaeon]|nr:class I SAM-dependent methyltransferase [Nanoarchaeota archaeon]
MKKLNLGCGKDIKEGYINLDVGDLEGVDVKHNLTKFPYPFPENNFHEILSLGTLELINADFIKIMEELHRICKDGAIIKIRSPAFPNQCSAQDPLTKKFMTYNSFEYFNDDWHY